MTDTFDTTAGLTGSNYQIKVPPADPSGAPPANSSPAGTAYLSVLGGGSATYTFGPDVHWFQFDWGSVNSFNTLSVNSSGGDPIIVPGLSFPNAANGDETGPGTNGLFTVVATAGETIFSVTFASTQNSFEVDNLAVGVDDRIPAPFVRDSGGVPEPATWTLMIAGFGFAGGALRRRAVRYARGDANQ